MPHLPRTRKKVYLSGVYPTSRGSKSFGQVIFRGTRAFLPGNSVECVENKGIKYGAEVAILWVWGRRAEDPFRGLRAGPVRFSPMLSPLVCGLTFLSLTESPENNP